MKEYNKHKKLIWSITAFLTICVLSPYGMAWIPPPPDDGGRPPAPTLYDIQPNPNHSGKVVVSWSSSASATSYYLYRSSNGGASYTRISTQTGRTYTDYRPDGTYYYRVKAYNNHDFSYFSNTDSVIVQKITPKYGDYPVYFPPTALSDINSPMKVNVIVKDPNCQVKVYYRSSIESWHLSRYVSFTRFDPNDNWFTGQIDKEAYDGQSMLYFYISNFQYDQNLYRGALGGTSSLTEVQNNPFCINIVAESDGDLDDDGLADSIEQEWGSDYLYPDPDFDHRTDLEEYLYQTDPNYDESYWIDWEDFTGDYGRFDGRHIDVVNTPLFPGYHGELINGHTVLIDEQDYTWSSYLIYHPPNDIRNGKLFIAFDIGFSSQARVGIYSGPIDFKIDQNGDVEYHIDNYEMYNEYSVPLYEDLTDCLGNRIQLTPNIMHRFEITIDFDLQGLSLIIDQEPLGKLFHPEYSSLKYFKFEAEWEYQQIYVDNFICEPVLLEPIMYERAMIPEVLGYYERPESAYAGPATAHCMKMTVGESSTDSIQGDFLMMSGGFTFTQGSGIYADTKIPYDSAYKSRFFYREINGYLAEYDMTLIQWNKQIDFCKATVFIPDTTQNHELVCGWEHDLKAALPSIIDDAEFDAIYTPTYDDKVIIGSVKTTSDLNWSETAGSQWYTDLTTQASFTLSFSIPIGESIFSFGGKLMFGWSRSMSFNVEMSVQHSGYEQGVPGFHNFNFYACKQVMGHIVMYVEYFHSLT